MSWIGRGLFSRSGSPRSRMEMEEKSDLDAERVKGLLPQGFPFDPILVLPRVESTNKALKEWGLKGIHGPGTVLAAEEQTAGRGRAGRSWISIPRRSLAVSLLARNTLPSRPAFLSIGAALAVAAAVEDLTGLRPAVKWPNDITINGRKVSGILIEAFEGAGEDLAVIGIGVNVNAAPPAGDEGFGPATSLLEASGLATDRSRLLAALLEHLRDTLALIDTGRGELLASDLRRRSLLLGKEARFSRGGKIFTGRVADHGDDLSIVLDTEEGRVVLPGEGTELMDFS